MKNIVFRNKKKANENKKQKKKGENEKQNPSREMNEKKFK